MSTATVNLAKYFDQRWKSYENEMKGYESRKAGSIDASEKCAESMQALEQEIANKEAVKQQASENGLDTSPLDKDIVRMRKEIGTLQKQRDKQERIASLPVPRAPYDPKMISEFVKHLAEIEREEAVAVPTLSAAASHIKISSEDLTLDEDGRVVKVRVRFAKHILGEVAVSPEHSRYAKSFRPKPLLWVQQADGELPSKEENPFSREPLQVFFVEDKQMFLLPKAYDFRYPSWGTTTNSWRRIDGDDGLFIFASSVLENAIEEAGGVVCLDQAYEDAFLSRICEDVMSLTLDHPRWSTNTEWPDSDTVLASIRDDLLLIVSAPWSDHLNGYWAKLKYTLENGERPRVWRKKHVDHYGIRLRTRDHTWLVGNVFIDRTQPPGKTGEPIEITHDEHTHTVGRMYVWIAEHRD